MKYIEEDADGPLLILLHGASNPYGPEGGRTGDVEGDVAVVQELVETL